MCILNFKTTKCPFFIVNIPMTAADLAMIMALVDFSTTWKRPSLPNEVLFSSSDVVEQWSFKMACGLALLDHTQTNGTVLRDWCSDRWGRR